MAHGGRCALVTLLLAAAGCGETVTFETDDPWQTESDWPGIGDGKILVTNSGDDTLSFLDPDTLEPLYRAATGRIPAEREGPHHAAATDDGSSYFVGISNYIPGGAGSGPHGSHGQGTVDGYLLRYDTESNALSGEVRVDRSPGDVRITPDGSYILQSHFDLQTINEVADDDDPDTEPEDVLSPLAVVDAESMTRVAMIPVCPAGHGVGLAPDGSAAYVACWGSDELAVVSLEDPTDDDADVERIAVAPGGGDPTAPRYGPYAANVTPDGDEVWVSNQVGASLSVYDVATGEMDPERYVTTGGEPFFATFSTDGALLYVPTQRRDANPDALVTIDRATGDVVSSLFFTAEECRAPHGTLLLADGITLALVCEGDHMGPGTVVRIDVSGPAPVIDEVFEVGVYPDDLVLIPGGAS